ncbi:MAG: cellulase family glycosylhydrolase [Acetobacteraceae bacterium]|nr:cellulase family glycosylhydrolase [Acetobacteraceae bacterium]
MPAARLVGQGRRSVGAMVGWWCAILLAVALLAGASHAAPPPDRIATLQRGINLTGWFRFPASLDPVALRHWIGDDAIAALHRTGFGFVRLAVDPAVLSAPGVPAALVEAIRRLQHAGLAVVVALHPDGWHLEIDPSDRARLFDAWHLLGLLLASLDPRLTVPELLNEPVFPGDPGGWQQLQHRLLGALRQTLPEHTVVLTGNDWGSVNGLLAMTPEVDPDVLYSIHLYDPAELTSMAAWRGALDRTALARLPFPTTDEGACRAAADRTDPDTAGVIQYYCAQHWDATRVTAKLAAAAAWGRRYAIPILLGEFGATAALNQPARLAWLRSMRSAAEAARMPWALWGYDDIMGLNIRRPPGMSPSLNPAVLQALGLMTTPK